MFSLISSIRPTLVNEFRYSTTFWSNQNAPPTEAQCPGCIGLGGPHVVVEGAGVIFGNQTDTLDWRMPELTAFYSVLSLPHFAWSGVFAALGVALTLRAIERGSVSLGVLAGLACRAGAASIRSPALLTWPRAAPLRHSAP